MSSAGARDSDIQHDKIDGAAERGALIRVHTNHDSERHSEHRDQVTAESQRGLAAHGVYIMSLTAHATKNLTSV
jgi:hypothetical protein